MFNNLFNFTSSGIVQKGALLNPTYVQIGSYYFATASFKDTTTQLENTIAEVQEPDNQEKSVNGDIEAGLTGWTSTRGAMSLENAVTHGGLNSVKITHNNADTTTFIRNTGGNITVGDWVVVNIWVFNNSESSVTLGTWINNIGQSTSDSSTVTGEWVNLRQAYKATESGIVEARLFTAGAASAGGVVYWDDLSIEVIGWEGSQSLKNGLIYTGETDYNALISSSFFAILNNNSEHVSTYGLIYNGSARNLIKSDIETKADYGYHVSTEEEWTELLMNEEVTLKKSGTQFWLTIGNTNATKFTALGGASRAATGIFGVIKSYVSFWCADSDKVVKIYDDSTPAEIVSADLNEGAYIRLVKDEFPTILQSFKSVNVDSHNGYTTDGTNHYTVGGGVLKKWDSNWNLIDTNSTMLSGTAYGHTGDLSYLNGLLYVAFEETGAAIAIFNASDLIRMSVNAIATSGASSCVAVQSDGENGIIYVSDFYVNKVYKVDMVDFSLIGTIIPSSELIEMQGITEKNGCLWVNVDSYSENLIHYTYKMNKSGEIIEKYKLRDVEGAELPKAHEGIDYSQNELRMLSGGYIYYFNI